MAGKRGQSGGKRDGAGRPDSVVRVRTAQRAIVALSQDGHPILMGAGSLNQATIEVTKRGTFKLTLDGGATVIRVEIIPGT